MAAVIKLKTSPFFPLRNTFAVVVPMSGLTLLLSCIYVNFRICG